MSSFQRVIAGKYLHYPSGYPSRFNINGRDRIWLQPGGVVDLGDPFIEEAVKGQEYKLEPDPKATSADALPHPKLIRLREEFMRGAGVLPPEETKADKLVAVGATASGDIPKPDARPQRGTKG